MKPVPRRSAAPPGADATPAMVTPVHPPEPLHHAATRLFGEHIAVGAHYAGLLAGPGIERGLLGPKERNSLWERHLLNCAAVAECLPDGASVCDVGSGAGLPGLVLAIVRPDTRVTLVEPLLRRVAFLHEAVAQLGLNNVEVLRGKAESISARRFDVVTSRAVAPLPRLLPAVIHLLAPGGHVLAIKGRRAEEELEDASGDLAALGLSRGHVRVLAAGILPTPTTVVDVVASTGSDPSGGARRKRGDR